MSKRTTWRYAVTLRRVQDEDVYEIREVYTGPRDALSWSAEPASPTGSTWLELVNNLIAMEQVFIGREVLDITDPGQPQWIGRSMARKS